jgi:Acetyltransferase (GNAT) domain
MSQTDLLAAPQVPAAEEAASIDRYEIRLAQHHDRDELLGLLAHVSDHPQARYDWIYRGNPHGQALSWLVVEKATGDAVACTSLFPRRVLVQGRERIGAVGGDTFVLPRARRLGLATIMHRHTRAEMASHGIDFNFSAPVPNNLTARVKAGCHVVAEMQPWIRPLGGEDCYRGPLRWLPEKWGTRVAEELVNLLNRWTHVSTGGLKLVPLTSFGPEFDRLFDDTAHRRLVSCVRDRAYLSWRYLDSPENRQQPFAIKDGSATVGFVAIEEDNKRAVVADLFTIGDPHLMETVVQVTINHLTRAGCSRIEMGVTEQSALMSLLPRWLFFRHGQGLFLQVTVPDDDPQATVLRDARAWHFLPADQDLESVC